MATPRARMAVTMLSWMLPLLTAGCVVRIGSCGTSWHVSGEHSVSERDGKLIVDGKVLPYDRWVDVDLAATGLGQLEVDTATGPIELQGGEQESCQLSVHVHSAVADDGEVVIADGKLGARSQHGNTVYINGVKGSVPAGISLVLETGTGDVLVEHAARGKSLSVSTGTGDVKVRASEPASLDIDTGAAGVRLEQGGATSVTVDCGAGDVDVVEGTWGTITVNGGSTDLTLKGATAESVSLDSGTGDLTLQDCTLQAARLDSGTGDLVISGGLCKRASIDSGTGEIEVRDGARVESQEGN